MIFLRFSKRDKDENFNDASIVFYRAQKGLSKRKSGLVE